MLLKFKSGGAVQTFVQPVSAGGTGATTAAAARTNLGIADHVVQQGTSGIWTYRKWNSGIAECWGKTGMVNIKFVKASSTTGATECEWKEGVAFPFTFAAAPSVAVTQNNADWANAIMSLNIEAAKIMGISFMKFSTAGNTAGFNVSLAIEAKGRWK